jgi:hypothetical protein
VLVDWDVVTIILIMNEAEYGRSIGPRTGRATHGTGTIAGSRGNEKKSRG